MDAEELTPWRVSYIKARLTSPQQQEGVICDVGTCREGSLVREGPAGRRENVDANKDKLATCHAPCHVGSMGTANACLQAQSHHTPSSPPP